MADVKKNPGKIVQYTKKNGQIQKAIMRYNDQRPDFEKAGKSIIRPINGKMMPILGENGKPLISLIETKLLTQIGFVD